MPIKTISPHAADALIRQGAVLIDIRNADEHAREHIALARHVPMEKLSADTDAIAGASALIFHCRSGNRTQVNAQALQACTDCDTYILEGGLDAWKQAGLPVRVDTAQPLELQRQVQIAAGAMVLSGTLLGATVTPWFYLIPGFIGAGLTFAGISGFCGLARLLMKMPWNRKAMSA